MESGHVALTWGMLQQEGQPYWFSWKWIKGEERGVELGQKRKLT